MAKKNAACEAGKGGERLDAQAVKTK